MMHFCWSCHFFVPANVTHRLLPCGHFFCEVCYDSLDEKVCLVCKELQSTSEEAVISGDINSNGDGNCSLPGCIKPKSLSKSNFTKNSTRLLLMNRCFEEVTSSNVDLSPIGWFTEDDTFLSETEDILSGVRDNLETTLRLCDELRQQYAYQLARLPVDKMADCRRQLSHIRHQLMTNAQNVKLGQLCENIFYIRQKMSEVHDEYKNKLTDSYKLQGFQVQIGLHNPATKEICQAEFNPERKNLPPQLRLISNILKEIITEWAADEKDTSTVDQSQNQTSTSTNSTSRSPLSHGVMSPSSTPLPSSSPTTTSTATPPPPAPPQLWSDLTKQNCPVRQPKIERIVPETNSPHCYLDIQIRKMTPKRVVIRLRPDKAPQMSENFIQLCLGTKGFGYKGSKIFRAMPSNHVLGGDFQNNNGSGGHSVYDNDLFLAEQCPLKDHKGAVRMRGIQRTSDGRCKIGSQFMIWVGDIEYKEYRYTLVFGHVTEGMSHLVDISKIGTFLAEKDNWLLKETVTIVNSGVL